ncbi:MAG: SpoIIE family protein phosphatase [Chitinivibrionales bacterium]|nr:SpoIIE family protein phosphatase [Chitinivibrionales bacterium]
MNPTPEQKFVKKKSIFNNKFPTIGLLTEGLSGQYQCGVWPGIVDAVIANSVNLLCFCGGSLSRSSLDPWDSQGNILYDLAQKHPLDGLIIAGSLGSYVSDSVVTEFLNRYKNLPLVTLAPTADPIPAVYVDNNSGMASLISHLILDHNYRKIAFIRGPEGNVEAEDRFRLFKEVSETHGITIDPECLFHGDFTRECGALAVEQLIKSGVECEVIVAADDETALGAFQALRAHGKQIPHDIALVGFDNIEESQCISPPLTTVSQPLYDLGRTAVEMVMRLLRNEQIPQNIILEARLVIRESCGCFHYHTDQKKTRELVSSAVNLGRTLDEKKMRAFCTRTLDRSNCGYYEELISSFCSDVALKTDTEFLKRIEILKSNQPQESIHSFLLECGIELMWSYCLTHLERESFAFADDLLHKARTICGELLVRAEGIRRIKTVGDNYLLHDVGDILKNALGVEKLLDAISVQLPHLGINSFYLSLYNMESSPSDYSWLKLACHQGQRITLSQEGILFQTSFLLPEDVLRVQTPQIFVIEPLYFQQEHYGILLLESIPQEYERYEILREYISGTLHSALLIEKVQLQAENLSHANMELEKLRAKEHAYLEAIKGELELGRKIQLGFLPQELPKLKHWDVSIAFMPAREVSGDFYDFFMMSEKTLALVIADVSGKDVSAALFMSLIRTLIRVFSERALHDQEDPLDAIEIVNNYIIQHHRQGDGRCMFATIVFGLLTLDTGEFTYINAGHNSPLILKNGQIIEELPPTGPAVGLAAELVFKKRTTRLNVGDLLFAYTDGVIEAQNPDGDFFTLKRLTEVLKNDHPSASQTVEQVKTALLEYGKDAPPFDDITILAVKHLT